MSRFYKEADKVLKGLLSPNPTPDQQHAAQEELERVAKRKSIILLGRDKRERFTGRGAIVEATTGEDFIDLFNVSRRHTKGAPADLILVRNEVLGDEGLKFEEPLATYDGRLVAIAGVPNMLFEDSRPAGYGPPWVEAGFVVREKNGHRFPQALKRIASKIIGA